MATSLRLAPLASLRKSLNDPSITTTRLRTILTELSRRSSKQAKELHLRARRTLRKRDAAVVAEPPGSPSRRSTGARAANTKAPPSKSKPSLELQAIKDSLKVVRRDIYSAEKRLGLLEKQKGELSQGLEEFVDKRVPDNYSGTARLPVTAQRHQYLSTLRDQVQARWPHHAELKAAQAELIQVREDISTLKVLRKDVEARIKAKKVQAREPADDQTFTPSLNNANDEATRAATGKLMSALASENALIIWVAEQLDRGKSDADLLDELVSWGEEDPSDVLFRGRLYLKNVLRRTR